jgi:hypothetical protein
MTLQCQILQDAKETDNKPLMELCQWLRQYGADCFYLRYDNDDFHASIVDFGDLHADLTDWFSLEQREYDSGIPNPPDIREWLQKEMDAGRYLAWISW